MNKEILAQILPLVEKTKEGILKGIEVLQIQMPDLVSQLIAWEIAIRLSGMIFGILLFFSTWGIYKLSKKVYAWADGSNDIEALTMILGAGVGICTSIIGIVILFSSFCGLLKVTVAPKIFLIEYVTNLLK